jgi:hypothetical protein
MVRMLHFIKNGDRHAYIDRVDALIRYASRYLKGKNKVLAKLLIEVAKGHFKKITVLYRTKSLSKSLAGMDMELAIMPQERVWGLALGWLG